MNNSRWLEFKNIFISDLPGGFVLQNISGEGSGSATKRTINYIDTDGASFADILYNPRSLEVDGFINAKCDEEMMRAKRALISACDLKKSFLLSYYNREKIYTATAICDQLPSFERRVNYSWNLPFKLYLTIPSFYWQGAAKIKKQIFKLHDEVLTSFTLPCVFTSLTNETTVNNAGDVDTFPNYVINCETPTAGSDIVITNLDTNQKIKLDYEMSAGEVVTIDSTRQTAESNINGNINVYLTIDTEFFPLRTGLNNIRAESVGNNVRIEFFENFIGV